MTHIHTYIKKIQVERNERKLLHKRKKEREKV